MTLVERSPVVIQLDLDLTELDALQAVAHHYESVMGVARHLVVATAPSGIKRRYRYIVQESLGLEQKVSEWRDALAIGHSDAVEVSIVDAVAFWGRLLSSLNTKRSRRRLSRPMISTHEALAEKIGTAVTQAHRVESVQTDAAIAGRRRREREWMLERLAR